MTRSKPFVRALFVLCLLAGLTAVIIAPMFASVRAAPQMQTVTHIVISQIYGGGGNTGAPYLNDYVELFNPSATTLPLTGWSIQYASATGTGLFSANVTNLSGSLASGQYYLVQLASAGAIGVPLPTPDATGVTVMGATGGKVALVNTTTGLACNGGGTPCSALDLTSIIDLIGYGTANFYEGSSGPAPAPSNTTADIRNVNGCYDTDNNSLDFTAGTPAPRNTGSSTTSCSGLLTATASAANLTGTAASNLTATASAANLTGTVASNLTGTANSNLTATASVANLTGTAASHLTATALAATICTTYSHHSLIINEVGWMGTKASSSDEWIELYNPSACTIDLTNWSLVGTNYYYTSGSFTITFPNTAGTIQPGGYYVIAVNNGVFQAPFVPNLIASSLSLLNNYQGLQLISPPNTESGILVDTANYAGKYSWPAGTTSPNYASMERNGQIEDGSLTAWVTYAGPTGPTSTNVKDRDGNYVRGTPGGPNWVATVTLTPSPVPTATTKVRPPTPRPPTPFAHVVINEFLPRAGTDWNSDGVVDINDEFIEIENNGPIDVNLSGWKLSDDPHIGNKTFTLASQTLKPGQLAVFYGSTTHILQPDSGDTLRLTNPSGVIMDARTYGVVKFPDQSICRIPDGSVYWRPICFPTPGNENVLTGAVPAPPPAIIINQPAPCLLPDTTPAEFRLAVCSPFGADIWNRKYWDDLAGQNQFVIPDPFGKGQTIVE